MSNVNPEPIEVILTRILQQVGAAIDELHKKRVRTADVEGAHKALCHLDVTTRRYLWRAVGWMPCDDAGALRCSCNELEPPREMDEHPCTGDWRGCLGCNENWITYADGVGEYDICKACHWDGKCMDEKLDACALEGKCDVYSDRHDHQDPR